MRNKWLALALLPGVAILAAAVQAQAPAGPAPRKVYTRKTTFNLPVHVDERERASLNEVRLFVKSSLSGPWTPVKSAPPTQASFTYQVPQDGEYWFSVATVDKAGRQSPPDVSREAPGLIVVVDTQKPEINLKKISLVSGEPYIQCEIRDANLDPTKVKVEYQAADQTWQPLEPLPDQPGIYRFPNAEQFRGVVRASATDRAGNIGHQEVNFLVSEQTAAAPVLPQGPPLAQAPAPLETRVDKVPSTPVTDLMVPSHQIINSTHATLAYQVEQQGPTGVGRVEVWMTRDKSQSWQFLCEDPHRRSPVEIDLPGDGLYGLSLVVSAVGAVSVPPASGETPDWWVEVDTTKPVAQILGVQNEGGTLVITWVANDNCLKPEPIDLYYATHQGGPWFLISRGLKNDGSYRWALPPGATGEVYVRMEVSDRAGNVTDCQTPQPVVLNQVRARARVIGLAASDRRLTPPQGH
jgi:hypothetical protein